MSLELEVTLAPRRGWAQASKSPAGNWLARPLFFLVVFGCAASLIATGSLTLRLAVPAAIWMSFIPLLQASSVAVVCRGRVPARRAVDLFAIGNTAWMLLLIAFAATWTFVPARSVYANFGVWRSTFAALLAWSAWMDYQFFRVVAGRAPVRALGDLALQRLLSWVPGLAIFVGPSATQVVEGWFGV